MEKEYWERRKLIEFCFKNENDIRLAIYEKRNDPNRPKSIGHGSGISKPTEIEAINRATPLEWVIVDNVRIYYPELWLKTIAIVKAHYNFKQHGTLYKLRYQSKFIRSKTIKKMEISKTRYHQLIIEIIDYAMSNTKTYMYGIGE